MPEGSLCALVGVGVRVSVGVISKSTRFCNAPFRHHALRSIFFMAVELAFGVTIQQCIAIACSKMFYNREVLSRAITLLVKRLICFFLFCFLVQCDGMQSDGLTLLLLSACCFRFLFSCGAHLPALVRESIPQWCVTVLSVARKHFAKAWCLYSSLNKCLIRDTHP